MILPTEQPSVPCLLRRHGISVACLALTLTPVRVPLSICYAQASPVIVTLLRRAVRSYSFWRSGASPPPFDPPPIPCRSSIPKG